MKKQIIAGIAVIAGVALCAAVLPRSAEVEDLPAEPVKAAVSAEIEARSKEMSQILLSAPAPVVEPVAKSEPPITEITTEKRTKKPAPTQSVTPSTPSSGPHNGDVRFVDGEKQIYLLGFGWIKDEGGGSVGTMVGNPGDQLTGHKVGVMGGGTIVDGKGDINKMVGIMGGNDSSPHETTAPLAMQSEITGDVIYTELQPPVTKDSTPPAYKPNGEPYNP